MGDRRSESWKWWVCALLLMATTINYMDRQTLSQLSEVISKEFRLSNEQYGNLEMVFGLAFAVGGLFAGLAADRFSVRWLFPLVLTGWSMAGLATAYVEPIGNAVLSIAHTWFGWAWASSDGGQGVAPGYVGLLICRTTLGFFESGQWPCALVVSQRILSRSQRTLGNSLLQSGAALGAIVTPIVVQNLVVYDGGGSWRWPFLVIGLVGLLWIVPWWSLIGPRDLDMPKSTEADSTGSLPVAAATTATWQENLRRMLILAVLVVTINLTWHFFRAWMPKFLLAFHHYDHGTVNYFTSFYYAVADVGCISIGYTVHRLIAGGMRIHRARVLMFWICTGLTALSTVVANLPKGPLLLALLLVIGFGSLGLFPMYYALTQEISARYQGRISGVLGATTWTCTALMQKFVGRSIDATGSYADGLFAVGLAPLVGAICLTLFWGKSIDEKS